MSHINSIKHIGKVARFDDDRPLIHGMNLMALRFTHSMDPAFGFAVLAWRHTKRYMEARAKKAVNQASINRQDIDELPLLLPPLPEQRRIAAVLDAIDDAIERTNDAITATERLRDALLHDLLSHGVPGWHSEWRDAPGLGTIPADWEVVRLGDVCERITKGTTPTTLGHQYTSRGVRFLRVENVASDGIISGGRLRFIDESTHSLLSRSALRENDIVLSIAGALGRSALIKKDTLPANVNQALSIIRLAQDSPLMPAFLAPVLRTRPTQFQVNEMRVELAQANISLEQVGTLYIPCPPLCEQRAIAALLDSMNGAIDREREQRDSLTLLKTSAADALLSGRVRVRR